MGTKKHLNASLDFVMFVAVVKLCKICNFVVICFLILSR